MCVDVTCILLNTHVFVGGFPGLVWDHFDRGNTESTDDGSPNVGYKMLEMYVNTYENKHSILDRFPTGILNPQPFVEGSRKKMERVAQAVRVKHGMDFPGAVIHWNEFLKIAPQTDDAEEYVKEHPLYVPFKEELFGISSSDERYAMSASGCAAHQQQIVQQKDENAANRNRDDKIERWQTLPCMDRNAEMAFERVKTVRDEEGKVYFLPYYGTDEDEDVAQNNHDDNNKEDDVDNQWYEVIENVHLPDFGDTLQYVGMQFEKKTDPMVDPQHHSGTIFQVALNNTVQKGELHFALVSDNSSQDGTILMVPCRDMMRPSPENEYMVTYFIFFTLTSTSLYLYNNIYDL